MPEHTFFGRYRATVSENHDPLKLGRLQLVIPDVLGTGQLSPWALPALPVAGRGMGVWALPPVGALVWVEFEQGDTDYPVWTGGYWPESGDVPSEAEPGNTQFNNILLKTVGGTLVLLSDAPGTQGGIQLKVNGGCSILITDAAIQLKARSGARIVLDDSGITLDNGTGATITLQGPSVSVNGDALTVI